MNRIGGNRTSKPIFPRGSDEAHGCRQGTPRIIGMARTEITRAGLGGARHGKGDEVAANLLSAPSPAFFRRSRSSTSSTSPRSASSPPAVEEQMFRPTWE
jgi:hypothetical protein